MEDMILESITLLSDALDATLRSQFGARIAGFSHRRGEIIIHFWEGYTPADETSAQAIIAAHDPVFITATRNGDDVMVSLNKPRNVDGASELTLVIDDTPAPVATALTANVGAVTVESEDEITIGIQEAYPHQEVTI